MLRKVYLSLSKGFAIVGNYATALKSRIFRVKFAVPIVVTLLATVSIYFLLPFLHTPIEKSYAASHSYIAVIGTASAMNTGATLTFNASPYNSNVKIDNESGEFSGYAWSDDLGWVAFGTVNNPNGPVSISLTTRVVTGKARVINTGADIDFNALPYHSNVVANSDGTVAGYAWSDDIGWFNFSSVNIYLEAPTNPSTFNAYSTVSKSVSLTTNNWYNYSNPYFEWSGSSDIAGVAGYYVYVGSNASADPYTDGTYQAHSGGSSATQSYTSSASFVSGSTYYLRLETINNVDNRSSAETLFTYKYDSLAPTSNPTTTNGYSDSGKATSLVSDSWYNYAHPYFEFSGAADAYSGIAGYYLYFGTDFNADPLTDGTLSLSPTNYTASASLVSGSTYFLRAKAVDNAGNVITGADTLFIYRYINNTPVAPTISGWDTAAKVTALISGSWYNYTAPYFEWIGASAGPGIAGYYVYFGSNGSANPITDGTWQTGTTKQVSDVLADGSTYYLMVKAKDNADNLADTVQFVYKFNSSVPSANPTTFTGYPTSAKTTTLTTGSWYNYSTPYFEWDGATDNHSGVKGYYVYFGTDATADPYTAGTFQTATNITISQAITNGETYYLRLRTINNANNLTTTHDYFTYKYDNLAPTLADAINVSPVGCSTSGTFTMTWQAATDSSPGSGFSTYEYRAGSQGQVHSLTDLTVSIPPYQEGDNVFYLRAKDMAGNASSWLTAIFCSTGIAYIIDGPTVTAGPSSVTVSWTSTKATTSYVQVYQGNTYISEQGHLDLTTSHNVKVLGLKSEQAYRYKIAWSDVSANTGESDWYTTNTPAAPSVKSIRSQIISPTTAQISWETTYNSSSTLEYGIGIFSSSIAMSGSGSTFSEQVSNLTAGSVYQVRIKAIADDGTEFYGQDVFTTPPLPSISSLHFSPIPDKPSSSMRATWTTNVETTSSLFYGPKGSSKKELSTSEKTKDHSFDIENLDDNSIYEIYASGIDQYGNTATSGINTFQTAYDTRPPKISDVTIETSNVGLGKTDTAQIAVSWKTDELATSQVEYDEGLSGNEYTKKTALDSTLTNSHLVIIPDLKPSSPYHLRVVSADKAGNAANSPDNTIISGEVPRSTLQLILRVLNNIFGWMGKWL